MANPAWSTRAIDALQQASKLNPAAAEPWTVMGELYHRKGFPGNAQACYQRARELDPLTAIPSDVDMAADEAQPSSARTRKKGLFG